MYNFASDNAAPVHPSIMQSLIACNNGPAAPYGADDWSRALDRAFSDLFEHEAFVFPCATGTAANGLAIASLTPPHGAVFCHTEAHMVTAEAGAPEFYSGGARLVTLPGEGAKLAPDVVETALAGYGPGHIHQLRPATLSVTQATEWGRTYTVNELAALAEVTRGHGLRVHLDGARFANALVHLESSPAEMSWRCGVDAVSLGTTKNGTMMAEAVLVFDAATAAEMRYRHKRAGLLQSKMRYFAAQLLAYIGDSLWLSNAAAANDNAARLARALSAVPGAILAQPVEANEVFVHLPRAARETFEAAGLQFRMWASPTDDLHRLVASYADDTALIAAVERCAAVCAEQEAGRPSAVG